MAEQLKSFDWATVGTPGESKYPWDMWLNGKPWMLKRGTDYDCLDVSIQCQAAKACAGRGVWVRTRNVGPGSVVLQAYQTRTLSQLRSNVVDVAA